MIERFYTTTFSSKRMVWDNDSAVDTTLSSFVGHIQQATPEYSQDVALAFGKTFLVWCAVGTDVESGDTLTVATGNYAGTYNVKMKMLNAIGANQHLELTVIKDVL